LLTSDYTLLPANRRVWKHCELPLLGLGSEIMANFVHNDLKI